ncbi:MAG: hypothetical protein A2Y10_15395 [Planctomycetes bacterium GWF2_41_51]|nr:MAG: hypothetical protein A2Y10_15395 [Planctomycetes bacterium GWF2_41_51]HBG26986.1 hypothetical protein [Phycisphaerales bacterium]
MKTKKIEYFVQKLSVIQEKPYNEQKEELAALQQEVKLAIPSDKSELYFKIQSIQNFLNMNTMLNACISAKWSCFWATIAAIAAFVSVILMLFAV